MSPSVDTHPRASAASCTHCALPLARGARAELESGEAYCCSGCFLAHRLGHRGLEARTDRLFARVALSAFLAMGVMVFSLSLYGGLLHEQGELAGAQALAGIYRLGALAFSTPVIVLLGLPLADAVVALRRWLSAEALILLGTLSAWAVSVWNTFRGGGDVYFDTATMVLLLYSVGRWLDVRARERATEELRRIVPERESPVILLDGAVEREVRAAELEPRDRVRVRPGEIVPVDGEVESGRSFADTAALTGEAQPRSLGPGDLVHAGVTLIDGSLVVRTRAGVGSRLRDEVERLLQEALTQRSRLVRIADRFAGALMPLVFVLAAAVVAHGWGEHGPEQALLNGLSVVLISCPCALGIATPLAFWSAMGEAWRRGVLVRGGEALERLARVRTVLLDKTGTLTSGEFELERIDAEPGVDPREALRLAAALEVGSEHPIARSIRAAWRARDGSELALAREFRALPGVGVEGEIEGRKLALESDRDADIGGATVVQLVANEVGRRVRLARLVLRSPARAEARGVLGRLRNEGCELAVLTGDSEGPARALAAELQVEVEARLSPADKVARIRGRGRACAFVGDGLNDAAALAAADVGISMAGGSASSLAAAHVNLLRPGLQELPDLLALARSAVLAAELNLAWAFLYNGVGLYLAATGRLTPIFAASSMVVSSVFSVLNSSRLIQRRREHDRAKETTHESAGRLRTRAYGGCA
ncbi:MAG: cadmium-translocating P-type ATPase [Planctomycetes bacterium]|nr:cadmium-translocating P-type ATPase [Planctomycetota bacterium]